MRMPLQQPPFEPESAWRRSSMTRRTRQRRTRSEPPAPREGGIPGSPSTTTSFTRTTTTTTSTRCVPTRPTTTRSSSASSFSLRTRSKSRLDGRPWRILRTRHLLWYYWWSLVGGCRLWLATSVQASLAVDRVYEVPTFSLDELRHLANHPNNNHDRGSSAQVAQRLHHVLTTTGLLSIALEDDTLQSSTGVWQDLCACRHDLEDMAAQQSPPPDHTTNGGVMHGRLSDGITWRTTLATATVGSQSPLPLVPSSWMEWKEEDTIHHNTNNALCQGPDMVAGLEAVRDSVSVATQAFVTAWDALVLQQHQQQSHSRPSLLWLHDATHTSYSSLASIQEAAVHLEHFHVYHKPPLGNEKERQETTQPRAVLGNAASSSTRHNQPRPASLPWHTDAGLFLSFVPGHTCHEEEESDPNQASSSDALWIQDPVTGQAQPAHFRPHTIGIMLGVGAQEWLSLSSSSSSSSSSLKNANDYNYRATKHAVVMEPGQVRAWYGMMTMVPDTALVQRHPDRTFAQMKQQLSFVSSSSSSQPSDDTSMVIGCGSTVSTLTPDDDDSSLVSTHHDDTTTNRRLRRRRLLQVQTAQACNNVTNFYCWMSCLDIPNARDRDVYLAQGYHLYCMDPQLYDRHASIEEAVQPCQGGSILNPSCVGKWTNQDPNYQVWAYDLESQGHSPQQAQLSQNHVHNHHDGTTHAMNEQSGHSSPHKGGESKTSNMLDDDAILDQPEMAGTNGDTSSSSSSSMGHHSHGNHGGMDSAFASSSTFCVGGTSMYMQGFSWQEPACVIFLLPHWVLTTPTKFAMASIATIVLGCILEWILFERRKLIKELPHGPNRIVWASGLYAIQLFLGYILMLIVMTYNAILFICSIGGLLLGNLLFNRPRDPLLATRWMYPSSNGSVLGSIAAATTHRKHFSRVHHHSSDPRTELRPHHHYLYQAHEYYHTTTKLNSSKTADESSDDDRDMTEKKVEDPGHSGYSYQPSYDKDVDEKDEEYHHRLNSMNPAVNIEFLGGGLADDQVSGLTRAASSALFTIDTTGEVSEGGATPCCNNTASDDYC